MRYQPKMSRVGLASVSAALLTAVSLCGTPQAIAGHAPDFSNPAVTLAQRAVIASGACIAKYTALMDDASKSAADIGRMVADRCAKEISRSTGLATWMTGKPQEFAANLAYIREDLTTSTVLRHRAAAARPHRESYAKN